MKTIFATFLILLLLLPVPAIGEIQTITHTVKQPFGGSQSPDDARIAAVAKAKREALEMAGVYVEALTIVKDRKVEKDEILALTAGVLNAEVVSQKNYVDGDAFGLDIIVKVKVDTSLLEERVKKLLQDNIHISQLKQAQLREKELLDKVAKLEKENQLLLQKGQDGEKLKVQFQEVSQGLSANELYFKALALMDDGKCRHNSRQIIEYLNQAIRLQPDFAEAYVLRGNAYQGCDFISSSSVSGMAMEDYAQAIRIKPDLPQAYYFRGFAYVKLERYQQADEDFNEAIRLMPELSGHIPTYYIRGLIYCALAKFQQAIGELNQLIRLQPDSGIGYYLRGTAYYYGLSKYQLAILDFNQAIRLQPDLVQPDLVQAYLAQAYLVRGLAYNELGQYKLAVKDFSQYIRKKSDDPDAYFNRGYAYGNLKQYKLAIVDFNKAIQLKPDFSKAYNNRGINYMILKNRNEACRSFQLACELGTCEGYGVAKNKGYCR